jgi:glycosyltransferase involved in cell wall biosynthesis
MQVSVIIPLYNKARHIQRAVNSVLAQTYQDFEVIVVDGGSTDGGADVVRGMTDPRTRLIVQKNDGVSRGRNRGVQEAAGELVAFLDADDEWLPCFLETVMGLRARYPEAGIYATAYRFSEGGRTWRPEFVHCVASPHGGLLEDYFRAGLGPPPVWTSATMIPKKVLLEVGGFPAGIRKGEDLHTWARIALRYRVAWSPVDAVLYHLDADNRTSHRIPLSAEVVLAEPIEAFLRSGSDPISSRRYVEEYLASRRLHAVWNCCLQGKRTWAFSLLNKTQATTLFRRRRLVLHCLVWLPTGVLRSAVTAKSTFRRFWAARAGKARERLEERQEAVTS